MRFRPLLWPALIALPMLAVLTGLGLWQLERREWKEALIAQMEERLSAPETPLETLPGGSGQAYRRVAAAGRFDHGKEVYWYTAGPNGEAGYHVITPLIREAGPAVLVDRGFVPAGFKDPGARPAGQITGRVIVHGIVREAQPGGEFTPEDDRGQRLVYSRDPSRISAEFGLGEVLPVFIEADATPNPGGYPVGGQTKATLRNEHLQYALTWFGLAAALLIVYLLYHRSRGRL